MSTKKTATTTAAVIWLLNESEQDKLTKRNRDKNLDRDDDDRDEARAFRLVFSSFYLNGE